MILDHTPRSFKAAVALVVMLAGLSAAFNAIGPLIMGKGGTPDVIKLIGGLVAGIAAAVIFYPEQKREAKSHEQIEVETLSRAGKEAKYREKVSGAQAWNMNDTPAEPQEQSEKKQ